MNLVALFCQHLATRKRLDEHFLAKLFYLIAVLSDVDGEPSPQSIEISLERRLEIDDR